MLPQVIQLAIISKSNENIDADSITASQTNPQSQPPISFDPTLEDRATDLINLLVGSFRETIQVAGRFPLSVTAGAVPPKAALHILNMAAFQLVNSTLNLQRVIFTEKGAYDPLFNGYKEGAKYLESIAAGAGILPPSDPTGIDYLTAVDPNTNPAVCAVMSAPIVGELDVSTDGEESGHLCRGTNSPNGNQQGVKGDVYEQLNAAGQVIKIWEKTNSNGNFYWQ